MSDPSVPEVSLIFGIRSLSTQLPERNRDTSEEECEANVNWKKYGFPSVYDSTVVTQGLVERQSNCKSIALKNEVSNNRLNFTSGPRDAKLLSNTSPIQYEQNQTIAVQKHCFVAAARNNDIDNTHLPNYEHPFRDKISAFAFPQNELTDTPVPSSSYDAIKSILKRSLLNNITITNPKSNNTVRADSHIQSKSSPQSNHCSHDDHQTLRNIDDSVDSRPSPVPRCQHTNEVNREHETVRDLLVLVKNQNDQIKSLQTQVERLLQIHEHNTGYFENRSSVITKLSGKSQSPDYAHETGTLLKDNVVVSAQKTCHSREINMMPSHPTDERSEGCLHYQSDPLRNAIMEKKVSIGVMTSFEFSVQNNPFVSDSDYQINAAFRDCGKKVNDSGEACRSNVHLSRKISKGPLENISEGTESHPSSIWKQSNNTQVSASEKFTSRIIANVKDNRAYIDDVLQCSPTSKFSQPEPNAEDPSIMFLNKARHPLVGLQNFGSHKNRVPVVLDQQAKNVKILEASSSKNASGPKKNNLYRQDDLSDGNRAIGLEFTHESCLKKNKNTSRRYSGQSENETRSMPANNTAEGSFVLHSSDFEVPDRTPLSLDPSIHVEMREYSSCDENEKSKHAPAVGWTFYKNVVGQVNRILDTIPGSQDVDTNEKVNPLIFNNDVIESEDIFNPVKSATLQRLKMLGISYTEHSEFNGEHTQKKVTFDSSYCPLVDYQTNMLPPTNSTNETNTSMHMKALALKYLSDEQLADLAICKQGHSTTMKHKLLSVHGTNRSLATMNYLQRYCLVSGMHKLNTDGKEHGSAVRHKKSKHLVLTKELLTKSTTRNRTFENFVNNGTSDNILDMTTLKQQPKLL